MKSAKERKMDRKRKHKALAAAKTEKSRKRRLEWFIGYRDTFGELYSITVS